MSILPDDIYEHVDDNWGDSGVCAAEYVYEILSKIVVTLEDEVDSLLYQRDGAEELRSRVEEAVHILNSANH